MSSICSQRSETGLGNELTRVLLLPTMRPCQRQVPCWCLSMAKVSPLQLICLTESRALLCLYYCLLSSQTALPKASPHTFSRAPYFLIGMSWLTMASWVTTLKEMMKKRGKKQQTANPFRLLRTALSEETGRPPSPHSIAEEWPDLPLYCSLFHFTSS